MKWIIDKSFDWCYGHRVHNQQLNVEFTGSEGACLACRHLHGHQGKLKVMLEGTELERGMVTDFKHLGWMKNFIDDVLDHKMILDCNDPLLPHEVPEYIKSSYTSGDMSKVGWELDLSKCNSFPEGYWMPDLAFLPKDVSQAVYEKYEGMVFVDFVPTSENLSAWLLKVAQEKMAKMDVKVVAVEFWETPKSHCRVEV
jgi:6-pyruvoyltetrahydropterin/6-carboxytetrahydropterin synthase